MLNVLGQVVRTEGRLLRIGRLEGEGYEYLADAAPFLSELRKSKCRIDIFTFLQKVNETAPKYDYILEWDNFAALPITSFDNWWNEQIGFKARNKAKQAGKKWVDVREVPFDDALVKGIWSIYNETPVRQGRRFGHFGKDIATVYKEEATFLEKSIFVGAFLGETLIGFVKMVYDEDRVQAGLMNIVSLIEQRDKAPTNALIAQAVRSCAERGISNLVYSNFAYGSKQRSSLSDFKERNGFKRVDVPRYYIPLTGAGRVALRAGLHHRLVDHVPEALASKLRELRDGWYNRRFQSLAKAE